MKLRNYQNAARECIYNEWKKVCSTMVVIPTGGGKTILFADVIHKMQPKRAMVVAHREELIWQARDKIFKVTGLECGVEMADNFVNGGLFGETPVVVSTVQTQNSNNGDRKRMGRFNPKDFGVLIIDECHHATAESYKTLIHYYKFNNPDIKILGVTATPDRADEEALGQVFDSVAYDYEILDAINDGWLVPIDQQFVTINGLDFSEMRTTAGDLNGADLAQVMEGEKNLQGVAGATISIVGNRRAIVFTASVKQAEDLCNIFNRHKPNMAGWVCGKTPKDERRTILEQFQKGTVQIVANCGVLTEGFDDAGVEVVVMARPTKSRSLYAQMAGRSTRPLPGTVDHLDEPDARRQAIASSPKPSCLIVDFVGNSGRHKLMTSADILGGKVSDDAIENAVKKAKAKGKSVRMSDLLEQEEDDIQEKVRKAKLAEEAKRANLMAKVRYNQKHINPFDALQLHPTKDRGWDKGRTLSQPQKNLLMKQGINPDTMSYAEGRQLLNEMFRRWNGKLCSMRQAAALMAHGYKDVRNMKRDDASKILEAIGHTSRKPNTVAPRFSPRVAADTTEESPFR